MELYCNGSERKLESGRARRHREDRKKNKEAEERGSRKAR